MAKAPKGKPLTQKAKLDNLKTLGFVGKSVKTFNKSVARTWTEFNTAFPDGKLFKTAALKTVSPEAAKVCRDVNMLVIGDKLVFPAQNRKVTIRETAKGVFVEEVRKNYPDGTPIPKNLLKLEPKTTIVLSKDGDHIKYGRELARKHGKKQRLESNPIMYGTLKTRSVKSKGVEYKTFMRDLARMHQRADDAIIDHRYIDAVEDIERDDYENTAEYLDACAETNGTVALIRVEF